MTRVSSGRPKAGPPTHQNAFAFVHNRASKLTKKIISAPISDCLCPRCKGILQWRKQFRKYKPLTVPKRCTGCSLKNVKEAYHVICEGCCAERRCCAKCLESRDLDGQKSEIVSHHDADMDGDGCTAEN